MSNNVNILASSVWIVSTDPLARVSAYRLFKISRISCSSTSVRVGGAGGGATAGAGRFRRLTAFITMKSASAMIKSWPLFFYAYPVERTFFTIVGSIVAIPVLRAIPGATLEMLRGSGANVRDETQSPAPSP